MVGELPQTRTKVPILKIQGGQSSDVVIVSKGVFGFSVHWHQKRQYMCPGEDCALCNSQMPSRWNGFFVVRCQAGKTKKLFLLEVSASAFDRFSGLARFNGWKEHFGLECSLRRQRAKSPLMIDPICYTDDAGLAPVSDARGWDAIATLYGLPSFAPEESVAEWEQRGKKAAARLVGCAARGVAI